MNPKTANPKTALLFLPLLGACASTHAAPEVPAAPTSLAELLYYYVGTTGHNVTYDEHTATLLESLVIEPLGPAEAGVLRVSQREAVFTLPPSAPNFELVGLQHASARDLAQTLSQLVAAAQGSGDAAVRIVADERTNSLLLMAPAEPMARLRDLIASLDRETPAND